MSWNAQRALVGRDMALGTWCRGKMIYPSIHPPPSQHSLGTQTQGTHSQPSIHPSIHLIHQAHAHKASGAYSLHVMFTNIFCASAAGSRCWVVDCYIRDCRRVVVASHAWRRMKVAPP